MSPPEPAKSSTILQRVFAQGGAQAAPLVPSASRPARVVRRGRVYESAFSAGLIAAWFREHWRLLTFTGTTIAYLAVTVYYYNYFIVLQTDVQTAWAQVEAQREHRSHNRAVLARIARDYEQHERDVLVELTKVRSDAGGDAEALPGAAGTGAEGSLSDAAAVVGVADVGASGLSTNLKLTAEQYPGKGPVCSRRWNLPRRFGRGTAASS